MIQKDGLFWSLFSAFFGMFDSPKQRGYPLWEGTENSSQLEAIKLTISDYPEYPLFMCSNSTLFGRPWCNKKPPWIHDSGRVKKHHNWIRNLLDYVGMRPTSEIYDVFWASVHVYCIWIVAVIGFCALPRELRGGTCGGQISCFFWSLGSWFHQGIQQIQGETNNVEFRTRKIDILENSKKPTFCCQNQHYFDIW